VLLLDDPTRGVDVGAKTEIVGVMQRLAADGMAIVFSTSDVAEIHAAANRALVMARGRIVARLAGTAMTGSALASAASAPLPEIVSA
jgi:ABC-type sugar transport system ATPase subunit